MFQAVSQNLTHLDIDMKPEPRIHIEISDGDLQNLHHACQKLKALKLRLVRGFSAVASPGMSPECFTMTNSILGAMLRSPELEELKISLALGSAFRLIDSGTILGSVLSNLAGNTLRGVCLSHFTIKIEELRQRSERAAGELHLEMNVAYLLNGTWAQARDISRGRTDSTSRIIYPSRR